ncbi:DUF1707 SHOCT-like domain-containing protein [Saccharomonospora piscinae]|uniref:DUF1707 SHOCT-like domain-containing protein n=1 Tax=Saccharomonospora piscinae TaxID=687388 RepID=UPI003CC5C763
MVEVNERVAPMGDDGDDEQLTAEQRRLRDLRVSDAEREHVVELLKNATGKGLLDLNEFTERADIAYASRTRGELNRVLVDLPGLSHPTAAPTAGATDSAVTEAAAPHDPDDHLALRAQGSNLVRKGQWVVPGSLSVRNRYAETRLEFNEAEFRSPVVNVRLDVKWGAVTIIVPEDASVDLNGLDDIKWTKVEDRTHGGAGRPRFVLTGKLVGSTLTLRHPRKSWFSF